MSHNRDECDNRNDLLLRSMDVMSRRWTRERRGWTQLLGDLNRGAADDQVVFRAILALCADADLTDEQTVNVQDIYDILAEVRVSDD